MLLHHYDLIFRENLQNIGQFFIYDVIQAPNWRINTGIVIWIFRYPSHLQRGRTNPLKSFTQFDCQYDMCYAHTLFILVNDLKSVKTLKYFKLL